MPQAHVNIERYADIDYLALFSLAFQTAKSGRVFLFLLLDQVSCNYLSSLLLQHPRLCHCTMPVLQGCIGHLSINYLKDASTML